MFLLQILILLGLMALGVPIAFAIGISVIHIILSDPSLSIFLVPSRMIRAFDSFVLIAFPFFLLAANLMNKGGITKRLIRLSSACVGFLKGGLAYVNVLVSMLFAGMSGSSLADAAGIGSIMIPSMLKQKYDKNFTVAVTACSSVMGVIIPPSTTMVIWGAIMHVSIAGLFLGGIIPGILIGLSQMVLVFIYSKRRNFPISQVKFDFKEFKGSLNKAVLAFGTPFIIVGGIITGLFTPTEAALGAVIYSLFLGFFIYSTLHFKDLFPLFLETGKVVAITLFSVGTSYIYGWLLAYYKLPVFFIRLFEKHLSSPSVILIFISVTFLITGFFLDDIPIMIIMGPLFIPLTEQAGINPIQYGIISLISLSVGFVTPPYGLCLFVDSKIAGINPMDCFGELMSFFLFFVIVILLLIFFPNLVLWLPKLLLPKLFV